MSLSASEQSSTKGTGVFSVVLTPTLFATGATFAPLTIIFAVVILLAACASIATYLNESTPEKPVFGT